MVNPFQSAIQRQEQERRERAERWQRWNDARTAQGINQAQADPNILAQPTIIPTSTGDIRQQYPLTSPTIPPPATGSIYSRSTTTASCKSPAWNTETRIWDSSPASGKR